MPYKIFHNPRCTKSRNALALLDSKNIIPEIIEYLSENQSEKVLKDLLAKGDFKAKEMIRAKEAKEEGLEDIKSKSDAEIIKFICANPRVMQRPIVMKDDSKSTIARDDDWFSRL